jgi:DnaJ-class molecular chaperone
MLLETPASSLSLPYRTLGIDTHLVTKCEIKHKYHKAALKAHPDKNHTVPADEAKSLTQQLNQARQSLCERNESEIASSRTSSANASNQAGMRRSDGSVMSRSAATTSMAR